MSVTEPEPEPVEEDPTAAELATLRAERDARLAAEKEAADAERQAEKAELETLRKEREERAAKDEADAKKVAAPKPKGEKPPKPSDVPAATRRRRVSRLLGDHYDDDDS